MEVGRPQGFNTAFASGRGRIPMTENGSRQAGHMIVPDDGEPRSRMQVALRAKRFESLLRGPPSSSLRIPAKAATYSNLIAATIPI
jgi:hypothetical protein